MKNCFRMICIIVLCALMLMGCGNESLDGTWVEIKQVDSDGTVRTGDEIMTTETFVFTGDTATDTVHTNDNSVKDVTITLSVVKISDTEYKLEYGAGHEYAQFKIEGNKFCLRIDTSINLDMSEYTDIYFEKQK